MTLHTFYYKLESLLECAGDGRYHLFTPFIIDFISGFFLKHSLVLSFAISTMRKQISRLRSNALLCGIMFHHLCPVFVRLITRNTFLNKIIVH
jgi:hypothetical protein